MADEANYRVKPLPIANYSPAIAKAVEWLGDRYLLAKPINARDHAISAARPTSSLPARA
jgi:hypothetical protein